MQNKSAALSNPLLRGYFLFSLDEAVELKAQEGHGVRLFRGLSRSNYRQRCDCRACWICGRSVLGVCIYDAVPELCRPVDIWHGSRTLRYGLWRSLGRSAWSTGDSFIVFFFFHFPVSHCTDVSVCLCLQFSDRCRHICLTCVRKLGPLMMLLIRRKTL